MNPRKLGFRMQGEWEQKSRTFMEWPLREEIWIDGIEDAKQGYADVAKAISKFEEVVMIAKEEYVEEAKVMCGNTVNVLSMDHDDSWMRDNGPTFLVNDKQELAGVNWIFNSWGDKFTNYDKDNAVAKKILEHYNVPCFDAPIVLEGGSIHVDGEGTLITTEECLLNANRNSHLNKKEIEAYLRDYLAIEKVIWLKRGLFGDETDGHVDNIACFVKPGMIMMQACYDENDPNYEITNENRQILQNETDAKGRKIELVEIEQAPVRYVQDIRMTLSYINYYPVNGGVIVPVFGGDAEETDKKALEIIQRVYPDREIVPVDGMPIIKGGGNVHCITQQMPIGKVTLV